MKIRTYDVRWKQRALKALGFYKGEVDGINGPLTQAATVAFKASVGLRARPYFGPITESYLKDAVEEAAPEKFGSETAPEPPWLVEIGKVMGLHETRDNAELRAWLNSDGSTLGDPDVLPWCGDAAITALELALPDEPLPDNLERNPYWARNFADYGIACGHINGAVAVFKRGKGGHVAFAVGYDPVTKRFLIRGGNQNDRVKDSYRAESGLLALRWPKSWPSAYQRPLPIVDAEGAVLSVNEA